MGGSSFIDAHFLPIKRYGIFVENLAAGAAGVTSIDSGVFGLAGAGVVERRGEGGAADCGGGAGGGAGRSGGMAVAAVYGVGDFTLCVDWFGAGVGGGGAGLPSVAGSDSGDLFGLGSGWGFLSMAIS